MTRDGKTQKRKKITKEIETRENEIDAQRAESGNKQTDGHGDRDREIVKGKQTVNCCFGFYPLKYLSNKRILLFHTELPFVLVASVTAQIRYIQLGHTITADSRC